MKLRTEISIPLSEHKIEIEDFIFSIGSCFATEISQRFSDAQIRTLHNPFGTLFTPYSINKSLQNILLQKKYSLEDLIINQNLYVSLDHHTSFDGYNQADTLEKINKSILSAYQFLKKSKWIIITYGTSFIHEYLPNKTLVANCHKIPNKNFKKRLLSDQEIQESILKTIQILGDLAPADAQILFTISPVRHTKDGIIENQWSKSRLINNLHQVLDNYSNTHYLPIYEIMIDDLRDYRFYKEDLIHPTSQAVDYIFNQFIDAYCSPPMQAFIKDNYNILKGLRHRPLHIENQSLYLQKLKEKIAQQQSKCSFPIFNNIDD